MKAENKDSGVALKEAKRIMDEVGYLCLHCTEKQLKKLIFHLKKIKILKTDEEKWFPSLLIELAEYINELRFSTGPKKDYEDKLEG